MFDWFARKKEIYKLNGVRAAIYQNQLHSSDALCLMKQYVKHELADADLTAIDTCIASFLGPHSLYSVDSDGILAQGLCRDGSLVSYSPSECGPQFAKFGKERWDYLQGVIAKTARLILSGLEESDDCEPNMINACKLFVECFLVRNGIMGHRAVIMDTDGMQYTVKNADVCDPFSFIHLQFPVK